MLKIVMVICLVMTNMSDSSFYYVEYDSLQECKEGFERIKAKPLPPGVENIYITCSTKLILKDDKATTTNVEEAFYSTSKD